VHRPKLPSFLLVDKGSGWKYLGEVARSQPMTVERSRYAQPLTRRPMKGKLMGLVTILHRRTREKWAARL
jgi:methionine synthase II (cobalamin-independent)